MFPGDNSGDLAESVCILSESRLVLLLHAATGILDNISMSQLMTLVQFPIHPSQFLKIFLGQLSEELGFSNAETLY